MRLPSRGILFFVIFVEGFAVLASELLAIRQIIPYAGSGTDTISIIIAAVLLPLAFGNYIGGKFKANPRGMLYQRSVRNKMLFNIVVSMVFLLGGLSHPIIEGFIEYLASAGITDRHAITLLYSFVFMVVPIYLLGQTLPLTSHYFAREDLQQTTGKILFSSTTGSFMGSVFCTLVLMATIGVHHTVIFVIACLCLITLILSKTLISKATVTAVIIVGIAGYLNSDYLLSKKYMVANNQYHMIQIVPHEDDPDVLTMKLNGNESARFSRDQNRRFPYERYINTIFIDPISQPSNIRRNILIIGAGGFIVGKNDRHNYITYVDIDEALLEISEEQFLDAKLTPNKTFVPLPARAFLTKAIREEEYYDMVILDIAQGNTTIPEHLVTREFYAQVRTVLKEGGLMVGNFIVSPNFADTFSRRVDNTLKSVFPNANRQVLGFYKAWESEPDRIVNAIYSAFKIGEDPEFEIYTDNLNRSSLDRFSPAQ